MATHLYEDNLGLSDKSSITTTNTSMVSISEEGDHHVSIPKAPTIDPAAKEFECPYCFTLLPINTCQGKKWEMHIYRDLRPYICTFEDCRDPDQQYDSLHDWIAHENLKHITTGNDDKQVYTKVCNAIGKGQANDSTGNCIFCGKHNKSAVHVASHLRRIALFALPRSTESESQDESPLSDFPLLNSSRDSGSKADAENDEVGLERSSMVNEFDDMSLESKPIHTGTSDSSAIHQTIGDKNPHQDLPGDSANPDHINEPSKGSRSLATPIEWTLRPHEAKPFTRLKVQMPRAAFVEDWDETPHEGIPRSQHMGNVGISRLKTPVDTHHDVSSRYVQEASTVSDQSSIGLSLWYCCQCNFGPHNKSLHMSCISCNAMQCSGCKEENFPY
ncbi:protein kinase [Penicillium pulvis]|uniref:protein kinase n=1 Tax=Penicillium pulvis TaxID=1562058 RepID=UPI0025480955|nr:protein kinase [Penicillium pulvis]KAJ5814082.1 protein kinase [Penicillium pulvis]